MKITVTREALIAAVTAKVDAERKAEPNFVQLKRQAVKTLTSLRQRAFAAESLDDLEELRNDAYANLPRVPARSSTLDKLETALRRLTIASDSSFVLNEGDEFLRFI